MTVASATTPPVTTKTTTSVPPLYQEALAQAKAALAAQTAPIQNEQAASDANFKQQETDATGAAAAVSKLLQPIGPAVNNMYQTAAQNQELAANGFSQGMQDALRGNTDNLNAMLQKLGSPAQLDSHAQQAGDVLYGLGGFNPGRSFSQQGAAFGSAADLQAGDALLKGQENVKGLQAKALVADQGFQNKIAELAGKLPGDVETNYQKLQSLALANKRFALAVQNQKFNQAAKIASQKLAVAKYNTSVDEFNARQQMTAAKFARQQFQQDRQYTLDMASLGVRQKSLQLRIAQNAYTQAHGGFSQAKVAKFNTTMDSILAGANIVHPVNGVTPTPQYQDSSGKWHDITADSVVPKNAKTRNNGTYANFITAAVKKGVPVQLAISRANTIWPETQRAIPDSLKTLPAVAAEAAKQTADYNQMVGAFNKNGQAVLATSPKTGQKVMLQMPAGLKPAAKATLGKVLDLAVQYMGTPYAWGGESPTGFDCSGLAQYIYAQSGIQIPRTTYEQFQGGLVVPKSQLQAGDLVFFQGSDPKNGLPGHVGIYIGNGKMIEAPHTGDVVKVASVSSFPGYAGARRYVH